MRRRICVPMILLLLLLTACGEAENTDAGDNLREAYRSMAGCTMEAEVSCAYENVLWVGQLRCDYIPDGTCTVEILAPKTIAGVKAVLKEENWQLQYEDAVLAAYALGENTLSPVTCLPRLIHALREGWLLEENEENWGEVPCIRLSVDESAADGRKIVSTMWLRREDGTPLRGEVALDGERILTAEFTAFAFYDKINQQEFTES